MKRQFRILDDEQATGIEIDDTIADFRTDRAATAGHDDGFAADEVLEGGGRRTCDHVERR